MIKLAEFYTNFSRIDLDTQGGYARVSDVVAYNDVGKPVHRAFKLMRHEIDYQNGMERFEDELRILAEVNHNNAPSAITRIYDSGFVSVKLSQSLDLHEVRV